MRIGLLIGGMLAGALVSASAGADEVTKEDLVAEFGKLFPSEPTECPETVPEDCVCGTIENRTNLPIRYSRVQACPHPVLEAVKRVRTFTADGALIDDMMFKNGKLHGAVISWHPNGQVESIATYDEGQPIGFGRTWHENGQVAAETQFVDGEPHGVDIRYTPEGEVKHVVVWNHGEPDWEATRKLARSVGVSLPLGAPERIEAGPDG